MTRIAQQFGFFTAAGVLTTLLDFGVYNLLTRPPLRWSRIRSNCCSVSVAICFSFTVNLLFVFQPTHARVMSRAWRFLLVTACSAYGIQNLVIYLTSRVWCGPADTVVRTARYIPIARAWDEEFVRKNAVKVFAVCTGLLWNFLWFRFFVFA